MLETNYKPRDFEVGTIDVDQPSDVLSTIRRLGLDFVSQAKTTKGCSSYDNRDAGDIKAARYQAKAWLKKDSYNPLTIWKIFSAVYKDSLEVDGWTGEMFLGSRNPSAKTTLGDMLNRLEDALDTALSLRPDFLERRLEQMVECLRFNPVQSYLRSLPKLEPSDMELWATLASKMFGTSDHLSQVKLSRWLIGAVARSMKPGCKMDTALVIKGKQGIGKTTFLQALFGDHFKTIHSHLPTLEKQRLMQQAWGCELGEIESTFRKSDISELKAFLTETHDNYRDLHKELGAARPRHCVFAGTTNETAFLSDPTGSRRFWVIDASDHAIPVKWVEQNRDKIWAIALHLYQAGEPHWMTQEEAELSEISNKEYQTENPLEEPLKTALDIIEAKNNVAIKPSDAARYLLDIQPANLKRHERDIKSALTSLGYTRKNFNNQRLKGWHYVKPDAVDPVPFQPRMADDVASKIGLG